jgi:hypothetical protein
MNVCRKERNNVYFSIEGVKGEYRFDIATGVLYGVKGRAIKYCPNTSLFRIALKGMNTNLSQALRSVLGETNATSQYNKFAASLIGADRMDSAGIPPLCFGWAWDTQYKFLGDHIKELQHWGETYENNWDVFSFGEFKKYCEYLKAQKIHGSAMDYLDAEMYSTIIQYRPDPTSELLSFFGYYLGRGKYWGYHNGYLDTLFDYLGWCELIGKTPQKVNNFMREWYETRQTYLLKKTEIDNQKIVSNYAKQSKAWEFTYGDYTIVTPTSGQDIVDEGENMHHCVGSYVDRVVSNQTYIVFVRRKDSPDKCHITCQVSTDGMIRQYYLAYDRTDFSLDDRDFRFAFAQHLQAVWNK